MPWVGWEPLRVHRFAPGSAGRCGPRLTRYFAGHQSGLLYEAGDLGPEIQQQRGSPLSQITILDPAANLSSRLRIRLPHFHMQPLAGEPPGYREAGDSGAYDQNFFHYRVGSMQSAVGRNSTFVMCQSRGIDATSGNGLNRLTSLRSLVSRESRVSLTQPAHTRYRFRCRSVFEALHRNRGKCPGIFASLCENAVPSLQQCC